MGQIINNRLKKLILPMFKIINLINSLFYKKQFKIVLYSNLGFRDNVKALYDYLVNHNYHKRYQIVCSVNDYKKYKKNKLNNVIFVNNYLGIFHFITSKYFFYSFGKYPIKPSKKQVVVNLWHGTPLKKIGNLEDNKNHIDYNYFTYVLATSEAFGKVMKDAFNCSSDQVVICGHPRNDLMFNKLQDNNNVFKKTIMWLPTFRKSDLINEDNSTFVKAIPIFNNDFKMQQLNKFLEIENIQLIIKLHPMQNVNGLPYRKYTNIKIWTQKELEDKELDLYSLLGTADALITDYSSVYFDYLLLNRPIGFTVDDIEQYRNNRGLIFEDPEYYMPGPKIKDEHQFFDFIRNVMQDVDEYKEDRERVNEYSNHFKDGGNCRRILDIVGIK